MDPFSDKRVVLTLDAGGTNFVFSALRSGKEIVKPVVRPSAGDDLDRCIKGMIEGFRAALKQIREPASAISFAFPGPADYPGGIIGDLTNLPAFRGGIPLGPILENAFGLPVYINNDGDLFTYGEALAGFLPEVNQRLKESGIPRQFRNLVGLTLGTGFGAGIYSGGKMLVGDNSIGAEVWLISNRFSPDRNAEETVSIRSVIRNYIKYSGRKDNPELTPREIFDIAEGKQKGDTEAARKAFAEMGAHLGDAIANLITLIDGLVVLGGGITGAARFFMPSVMDTLHGTFEYPPGDPQSRLVHRACYIDDEAGKREFFRKSGKLIRVEGSGQELYYDHQPKTAIGISRMGTSRATSLGAYAFALGKLDEI